MINNLYIIQDYYRLIIIKAKELDTQEILKIVESIWNFLTKKYVQIILKRKYKQTLSFF